MKKIFPLLFLLPLVACVTTKKMRRATSDREIKKDIAIIKKSAALFSQAIMNQDYDFVVNAYTEDAKIFPNGTKILAGKEAIRNYWTPPADSKYTTTYHKVTPEEIKIIGNEAYDYGYYEGTSVGEDGKESNWKGKYVITWKEVSPDVWKMYLDIWNSVRN